MPALFGLHIPSIVVTDLIYTFIDIRLAGGSSFDTMRVKLGRDGFHWMS